MIRKIGIVAWPNKTLRLQEAVQVIRNWNNDNPKIRFFLHKSLENLEMPYPVVDEEGLRRCHAFLAIGGDGTMLAAARIALGKNVPLLGVNTGRLGFLTEARLNDLPHYLDIITSGSFGVEHRLMIDYAVLSGNRILTQDTVLNEVQIQSVEPARMVDVEVKLDGNFLTEFWADSLLISTPTGSTAYNLSAGGPLLHPATDALILNPVNPFSLAVRPLVLAASTSILSLRELNSQPLRIMGDGRLGPLLLPGQTLRIRKSRHSAQFVETRSGFGEALREKLGWTGKPKSIVS